MGHPSAAAERECVGPGKPDRSAGYVVERAPRIAGRPNYRSGTDLLVPVAEPASALAGEEEKIARASSHDGEDAATPSSAHRRTPTSVADSHAHQALWHDTHCHCRSHLLDEAPRVAKAVAGTSLSRPKICAAAVAEKNLNSHCTDAAEVDRRHPSLTASFVVFVPPIVIPDHCSLCWNHLTWASFPQTAAVVGQEVEILHRFVESYSALALVVAAVGRLMALDPMETAEQTQCAGRHICHLEESPRSQSPSLAAVVEVQAADTSAAGCTAVAAAAAPAYPADSDHPPAALTRAKKGFGEYPHDTEVVVVH